MKYRFIPQSYMVPEVGVFPMIELPTGSYSRGLGVGKTWYKLPLWIQIPAPALPWAELPSRHYCPLSQRFVNIDDHGRDRTPTVLMTFGVPCDVGIIRHQSGSDRVHTGLLTEIIEIDTRRRNHRLAVAVWVYAVT